MLFVNPFQSEGWFVWGWVSDLLWWGVGRSTFGEGNFYWMCRPLICNFTEHVSFLQVFFMHFAETDYLPRFYVDRRYPGRKELIVTCRQVRNCDMTTERMYMWEIGRTYIYMCAYMGACRHACLCGACGYSHVLLLTYVKNFNCILIVACICA